ncbi:MAG: hypothetical protein DI569_03895 [Sphingopyxis macrogoltabida]|uniref:Terminase n=1 Tax=Sphingopyxis macrogoltabida TaxID=33050 RepID=A0A2W5L5M7_SPHMC|nr:MAG: hypothetical protein DI569_03895 [Sphingopyxis macrogoltabida]
MDDKREDEVVSQRNRPVQAKAGKPGGWTKAKREAFLVELAASCNIVRAAALVGMRQSGAYRLRKREPAFAAQWQAALEIGYERLETALVRRALETVGEFPVEAIDERRESVDKMTVDQAIRILTFHRESIRQGKARTRRPQGRQVATQEETDAALIKRIRMVERQRAAHAPRPGTDMGSDAAERACA